MTVLSDTTIRDKANSVETLIWPWSDEQLQPASYDLLLEDINGLFTDENPFIILQPGEFVLGSTKETVNLPSHIVGRIEGKSSWARKGIIIHTAGFVDPGFKGTLVLEITNLSQDPIELRKGIRIAQIAFQFLDKPSQKPYGHPDLGSHYQNQEGVVKSWIR